MPYAIVIWRRESKFIDIAGLKQEDLGYLEKIPCLATRLEVDSEGFIRFGPSTILGSLSVKPAVVLTGLEVLGFKVVSESSTSTSGVVANTEHCWTLRREFSEPEPKD